MKSLFFFLVVCTVFLMYGMQPSYASYVDPTGSVEGRVKLYERSCDAEGVFYAYDQVNDADVRLYDEDDDKIDSDDSDSDGEFSFDGVDVDKKYYIKCEKKGYVDAKDPSDDEYKSGKFDVDADKTVVKNCRLMKDEPLDCVQPFVVTAITPPEAECGEAQQTYKSSEEKFDGVFCAVGTAVKIPSFPEQGLRTSWVCKNGESTERCSAMHENAPVASSKKTPEPQVEPEPTPDPKPVPEVQAGTEPTPKPDVKSEPYHVISAFGLMSGTAIAFATSAVPLFATVPMAAKDFFIMPFIGLLARRKNEQNWGTVFENTTKQPLPATKLTLVDQSGKEIETTYSDQHGRFGFLTDTGTFMILPEKSKYEVNYKNESDALYGEVYTGNQVTIDQNTVLITNIAMDAVGVNWAEYAQEKTQAYTGAFATFKKWSFIIIFYLGFVATAAITYFYPTMLNFILLTLYGGLFVYDNFFKHKKYGMVQTDGNEPVPFAVVSLHDKDTAEKNSFAVTDAIGRYYLLSENGNYDLKVKGQPLSGDQFEKQGSIHVKNGLVRENIHV